MESATRVWIWNLTAGIAVPHPRGPRLNRGRDGIATTSAPVFARSPDSSGRRSNLGGDDDRTGKTLCISEGFVQDADRGQLQAAPFFISLHPLPSLPVGIISTLLPAPGNQPGNLIEISLSSATEREHYASVRRVVLAGIRL